MRVLVWIVVGAIAVFLLNRTTFGRAVYGIGNKEAAAYLSGVPTQRVVMAAFALCGALAAFGGVLLAGYAGKAAQSMGDAYLLPAIAAVVLGGTSILGGRGTYLGTVAGAILITLLQSILSVMQIAEFGRQIIYGVIIVGHAAALRPRQGDAVVNCRRGVTASASSSALRTASAPNWRSRFCGSSMMRHRARRPAIRLDGEIAAAAGRFVDAEHQALAVLGRLQPRERGGNARDTRAASRCQARGPRRPSPAAAG